MSANLLDLMTPEEKEKVQRWEQVKSNRITAEWMAMAELGFYYGWQAVRDLIDDVIDLSQANMLIIGARKIHSSQIYDHAVAGAAANAQKKGSFEKIMKPYAKDIKDVQ